MNSIQQLQQYFLNKDMIILIDSDLCGMDFLQKELTEKLLHKSNNCIILIDSNENIFGGIVFNEIDNINEWIEDDKAMLFSVNKNELNSLNIFPIQKEESQYAFYLYSIDSDALFAFGENRDDLYVCITNQFQNHHRKHSFCYPSYNCFVNYSKFIVKRVIVVHFM